MIFVFFFDKIINFIYFKLYILKFHHIFTIKIIEINQLYSTIYFLIHRSILILTLIISNDYLLLIFGEIIFR